MCEEDGHFARATFLESCDFEKVSTPTLGSRLVFWSAGASHQSDQIGRTPRYGGVTDGGKLVITREPPGWRGPRERPQGSPRVRAEGAFASLLPPSRSLARGHSTSNRLRDHANTLQNHVSS